MRLLVVEDEAGLREQLQAALAAEGFVVEAAGDGKEARWLGESEPFDAIVLDLGLPQLDGVSVLQDWRRGGIKTPVLVLTARERWHDKLAAFSAGADDYLTKPFDVPELVVRLRALIRRSTGHASPLLSCGELELDTHGSRFFLAGKPLQFTAQEYRILAYLMHHAGRVVSRTELYEHIYDSSAENDSNVIDVLIGRIRKKLGVEMLHTVRGLGFRLGDAA